MKTSFRADTELNKAALPQIFEKPAILNRYRRIFHNYRSDGIIDIDRRLKEKNEFTACRLEDILSFAPVPGCLPPVRSSNYMIVLITNGKGEKIIGGQCFQMQRHSLYFITKRMVHSSRAWSPDTSGFLVNFNADFFDSRSFPAEQIFARKLFKTLQTPCINLTGRDGSAIEGLFEQILEEFNRPNLQQNDLLVLKMLELLIGCERLFQKAGHTGNDTVRHPVVDRFIELVELNFSEVRNVQWYADQLCVHPNHLNYLLKKHTGINAKESINNRIILEAKTLLDVADLMIKDVAHRVGFDDPNNFSTFFQKNTGFSPVFFRNSRTVQKAPPALIAS